MEFRHKTRSLHLSFEIPHFPLYSSLADRRLAFYKWPACRLAVNYQLFHKHQKFIARRRTTIDDRRRDSKKRETERRKVLTCPKMASTWSPRWRRSCDSLRTVRTTTASGDCTSCSARSKSDCTLPNRLASGRIDC